MFRRAATIAYDGVQEMGSQLRRSFRSTKSRSTTAWHSVMKRKSERDNEEEAEEAIEATAEDNRRKNAGEPSHHQQRGHTNVVIYAGVLRTYDMTGFSNLPP